MHQKFLIAATVFAAALPALAGTIATTTAQPRMTRLARADNVATQSTSAGTGRSAVASDSTRQKNTPAAKPGGLLNSDASPAQANAVARDTNRQIARGEIRPSH